MIYLIISIVFYLLLTLLLIIWLVNFIRKAFIHWEYMKRVEGKFENYETYWDTVFSFDFSIIADIIQVLLPIYSRNHQRESNSDEFRVLGERLKKVFWWGWGSFIAIFSIQIIMLIVTLFFEIL